MSKRLFGVNLNGILPFAVGAAGVAYYTLQTQAPHVRGGSARELEDWEKHVQVGQVVAAAALSAGVLLYRLRSRRSFNGGSGGGS
jgi:hypothetical protein